MPSGLRASLRAKLGDDAARPRYLETVRGLGYRLLPGGPG
jgi:DNA-binding response OmpR family regulator